MAMTDARETFEPGTLVYHDEYGLGTVKEHPDGYEPTGRTHVYFHNTPETTLVTCAVYNLEEHDCRERVRGGHASLEATHHTELKPQLHFECDVCGSDVYLICEPINIQISYKDGVLEPTAEADRADIYDAELRKR